MLLCIGHAIHWDPHDPECNYELCPRVSEDACSVEIQMPQRVMDQLIEWHGTLEGVADSLDKMFPDLIERGGKAGEQHAS